MKRTWLEDPDKNAISQMALREGAVYGHVGRQVVAGTITCWARFLEGGFKADPGRFAKKWGEMGG